MAFCLLCRSFFDSHSFLWLSLLPDGVYMSEMCAWLVTDWPWSPTRTEAIFKPKPPKILVLDRHAYLVSTPSVCECVSPVLSLVFPCYTGTVTLWICWGNSGSVKSVSWVACKVLWSCNHCHDVLIASLRLCLSHLVQHCWFSIAQLCSTKPVVKDLRFEAVMT